MSNETTLPLQHPGTAAPARPSDPPAPTGPTEQLPPIDDAPVPPLTSPDDTKGG